MEFFKLVKEATQKFDFNGFSREMRLIYQESKRSGFENVLRSLITTSKNNQSSLEDILLHQALAIGEVVFEKLPKDKIIRYIPFNDFRFLPKGNEIIVQFRALNKFNGSQGVLYYSHLKPTVEIDGTNYIVAFSKHAIEQICNRIHPNWINYSTLGDVYAYLEENIYFEVCQLRDGSPAITFWDWCGTKRFWHYQYVKQVLGEDNLVSGRGKPYFRVGYCPIAFDGEFVNAKTLLFPGYSKTPEYEYILKSSLSQTDKELLRKKVTQQDAKSLMETGDFSGIRWLHMNAIPQVIQMEGLVYAHHKTLPVVYHQG